MTFLVFDSTLIVLENFRSFFKLSLLVVCCQSIKRMQMSFSRLISSWANPRVVSVKGPLPVDITREDVLIDIKTPFRYYFKYSYRVSSSSVFPETNWSFPICWSILHSSLWLKTFPVCNSTPINLTYSKSFLQLFLSKASCQFIEPTHILLCNSMSRLYQRPLSKR